MAVNLWRRWKDLQSDDPILWPTWWHWIPDGHWYSFLAGQRRGFWGQER